MNDVLGNCLLLSLEDVSQGPKRSRLEGKGRRAEADTNGRHKVRALQLSQSHQVLPCMGQAPLQVELCVVKEKREK